MGAGWYGPRGAALRPPGRRRPTGGAGGLHGPPDRLRGHRSLRHKPRKNPGKLITRPLAANSASSPPELVAPSRTWTLEALGVGHLGGDRAFPDQLVQSQLVAVQPALLGVAELVAGGADGFVGFLGIFHPLVVTAGARGEVVAPVQFAHHPSGRRQCLRRQRGAVRAHVGNVARLVQVLGHPHGTGGRKP